MLTVINSQNLNPGLLPFLPPNQPHIHPSPNRHFLAPPLPLQHPVSIPFLSIPLPHAPLSLLPPQPPLPSFPPQSLCISRPPHHNQGILQVAGRFEPTICASVTSSLKLPQSVDRDNTRNLHPYPILHVSGGHFGSHTTVDNHHPKSDSRNKSVEDNENIELFATLSKINNKRSCTNKNKRKADNNDKTICYKPNTKRSTMIKSSRINIPTAPSNIRSQQNDCDFHNNNNNNINNNDDNRDAKRLAVTRAIINETPHTTSMISSTAVKSNPSFPVKHHRHDETRISASAEILENPHTTKALFSNFSQNENSSKHSPENNVSEELAHAHKCETTKSENYKSAETEETQRSDVRFSSDVDRISNFPVPADKLRHSIAAILNMNSDENEHEHDISKDIDCRKLNIESDNTSYEHNSDGCGIDCVVEIDIPKDASGDVGDLGDVPDEDIASLDRLCGTVQEQGTNECTPTIKDEMEMDQEEQPSCLGETHSISSIEPIIESDDDDTQFDDMISVEDCDDEIDVSIGQYNDEYVIPNSYTVTQLGAVSWNESAKGHDEECSFQEPIIDSTHSNDVPGLTVASPGCDTTSHLKRLEDLVVKNDVEHFNKDEFFNAKTHILESSQSNIDVETKDDVTSIENDQATTPQCADKLSKMPEYHQPLDFLSPAHQCCENHVIDSRQQPRTDHHCPQFHHHHCPTHRPLDFQIHHQQQHHAQRFFEIQTQMSDSKNPYRFPQQQNYHQQLHPHHLHHSIIHPQQHPEPSQDNSQKSAFKPIVNSRLSNFPPFSSFSQQHPNAPLNDATFCRKQNTLRHNPHQNALLKSPGANINPQTSLDLSPSLQNSTHLDAISLLRGHSIDYQKIDPMSNQSKPCLVNKHPHNTIGAWLTWVRHRYANHAPRNVGQPDAPTSSKRAQIAPRYHCESCNKTYSTFGGLSKHRQFHCLQHVKKEFGCKFCTKSYSSLGALKMHIRTHTLPCKCHVCGKAFSRPWLLQGHVRTHTGEKPFRCNHCGRAFADRSNLRAHLQTHAEIKKYACAKCGKTFSRMSLLNKHSDGSCPANVMTCI